MDAKSYEESFSAQRRRAFWMAEWPYSIVQGTHLTHS